MARVKINKNGEIRISNDIKLSQDIKRCLTPLNFYKLMKIP